MPTPTVVSRQLRDDGRYLITLSDGAQFYSAYDLAAAKGATTPAAVAPTTSATLLVAANAGRRRVTFVNNGTVPVYLGTANTVTTATGAPLLPGASAEDADTEGAWYGITASGTGDIRVIEVS